MSVIPFSFDWEDLIGNQNGQIILSSTNYVLKGLAINVNGYIGSACSPIGIFIDDGFIDSPRNFSYVLPQPWQNETGFESNPFTYYNKDICNIQNVKLQGLFPCTLNYQFNGNGTDIDPENLIISGSIII